MGMCSSFTIKSTYIHSLVLLSRFIFSLCFHSPYSCLKLQGLKSLTLFILRFSETLVKETNGKLTFGTRTLKKVSVHC